MSKSETHRMRLGAVSGQRIVACLHQEVLKTRLTSVRAQYFEATSSFFRAAFSVSVRMVASTTLIMLRARAPSLMACGSFVALEPWTLICSIVSVAEIVKWLSLPSHLLIRLLWNTVQDNALEKRPLIGRQSSEVNLQYCVASMFEGQPMRPYLCFARRLRLVRK